MQAIASHLICPTFMNDDHPEERRSGIDWQWAWQPGVPHWFFVDFGMSKGMRLAEERCCLLGLPYAFKRLQIYRPNAWEGFMCGNYPPGMKGARPELREARESLHQSEVVLKNVGALLGSMTEEKEEWRKTAERLEDYRERAESELDFWRKLNPKIEPSAEIWEGY